MVELAPKIKQPEEKIATTADASSKEVVDVKIYDKTTPLTPEQQQLVEQGYDQVKIIALRMFNRMRNEHTNFTLDDFIGWGDGGLVEAAQRFNTSMGSKFGAYAEILIRGRILDNLRKTYPVDAIFVSMNDVANDEGFQDTNSLLDFLIQIQNPYSPGDNEEEKEKTKIELLNKFLTQLNLDERERQIMDDYFSKGLTMKEIGEKLNLSESLCIQIKNTVIRGLRELFKQEGYRIIHTNQRSSYNKSQKQKIQ